jgi:transformation/transcription domain-associated protein
LTDIAKHESNCDLLLEASWRTVDWTTEQESVLQVLQGVSEMNPRKKVFEVFRSWTKLQEERPGENGERPLHDTFSRLCDEGIQHCLRQWTALPEVITGAHIPLLHTLQQYVEFGEAATIQHNLLSTNQQNAEVKSTELKGILQIWKDRLPNTWDDINIWSDLVSWRQHVFTVINKSYMPLLPVSGQPQTTSSFAYRGYHETASIINRFANVARKHKLTEVCVSQLTKIYTLPNIEIHEAFYKLREQAKCYMMTPSEWPSGLDVVNNTNLMYFSAAVFFS